MYTVYCCVMCVSEVSATTHRNLNINDDRTRRDENLKSRYVVMYVQVYLWVSIAMITVLPHESVGFFLVGK